MSDKEPKPNDVEKAPLLSAEDAVRQETEKYEKKKKRISAALIFGAVLRWFMRTGSFLNNALELAHVSIRWLGEIFPPAKAMVSGYFFLVEMTETLFISKEKRNRRVAKVIASTIGTGLSIASTVLMLHPVTLPLGAALSAGAMAVAAVRDLFFWYKTAKDIRTYRKAVQSKEQEIHAANDADKPRLEQERRDLYIKLNVAIRLNQERRRSFFYNAFSCIGMALIAVAAFAVIGAIAVNPFIAGVVGVAILGTAIVGGFYHLYKKSYYQELPIPPLEKPVAINVKKFSDDEPKINPEISPKPHVSDTVTVLGDLAAHHIHSDIRERESVDKIKALAAGQIEKGVDATEAGAAPLAVVPPASPKPTASNDQTLAEPAQPNGTSPVRHKE